MNTVIFDLETTSAEKDTCRIIQLAIKQIAPDGTVLINASRRYRPDVPIAPSATEVHGISDTDVAACPSFYSDCKKLKKIFEGSILMGYNIIVFDIPVLLYEFDRAGVELNLSRKIIDIMKLETQLSPRTLSAVYERYTGQAIKNAHDALADVNATEEVFVHQCLKIERNKLDEKELLDKSGLSPDAVDFFGKLKRDPEGYLIYAFGKKALGKRVIDEPAYTNWILGESFPSQVKALIREELQKNTKKEFTHPSSFKSIGNVSKTTPQTFDFSSPIDDLPF